MHGKSCCNEYTHTSRVFENNNCYEFHPNQQVSSFDSNIVNLTHESVPNNVAKILSLGDKYNQALKPNKIDILNILKNIENTVNSYTIYGQERYHERERNTIRNKILKCIYHYDPTKVFISSQEHEIEMNKKHTRQFMRNNPNILITKSDKGNKTVLIYKSDYIQKVEENLQNDNRETKVVIPYIKNFSERIKRILSRHDIHTIFKSNNKFDEFIRLGKDKLNHEDRTHVVYELNCLQCPKSYVGQTKRQLKKRVKEHRNNLTSSSQEPNVLSLHKIEHEGHDFDWNNPNILDTEPHYTKRTISEMFRIQLNNHGLNVREDTKKLNSLYKNFFIDFEKLKKFK
ncbi:hypothetical protein QAD02_019949 [Eretmocerus hayati]|uniref:Uncharacterized protein n=1 Tax=Eretmocerus hayati TaxID=131215 RepID=A0ACC2PLA4_9HYME|nr:hypothetical protein QAD02_019949 [Eretmocerus hayati]